MKGNATRPFYLLSTIATEKLSPHWPESCCSPVLWPNVDIKPTTVQPSFPVFKRNHLCSTKKGATDEDRSLTSKPASSECGVTAAPFGLRRMRGARLKSLCGLSFSSRDQRRDHLRS